MYDLRITKADEILLALETLKGEDLTIKSVEELVDLLFDTYEVRDAISYSDSIEWLHNNFYEIRDFYTERPELDLPDAILEPENFRMAFENALAEEVLEKAINIDEEMLLDDEAINNIQNSLQNLKSDLFIANQDIWQM